MKWSDIPFQPSTRTLRTFAGLCLVIFGSLAIWQGFVRGNTVAASIFVAVAGLIGIPGLIWPTAIRWIYVGWMVAVFPIGWTVSLVMLAILFYGVFTPMALLFRLIGRDALSRRYEPGRTTYWEPRTQAADIKSYFRQF